jgi:NADPH:quinone reductase-like Zn-dependent oxidoreductase
MKAIVYRRYGGPEVLEATEIPEPKMMQDSVLVRIKAAGLNPADIGLREGVMDHAIDAFFPVVPGWDLAGVVEEAGPGAPEFAPGDEVIGFLRGQALHYGTYAEKVAADVRALVHRPRNLTWAQAAGLPVAGLTAYQAIVQALKVAAGETLLVHAASGGVGSLAAQIAVARGARVIGTASEANHSYLASIGAQPVAYGDGLADRVRELVPDGVDAVLDTAGRGVLATTPFLGKPGVRVASVVDATAYRGTVPVFVRMDQTDFKALVQLVETGKVAVRVARTYPLVQAAEAQTFLAEGHSQGKVVLITD